MDSITKLVKDPTWWFTAIFVGIFASLVASYFRDGISWVAAHTSKALRARRNARLAREQQYVHFLTGQPTLLLMEMVRTSVRFVLFLGLVGIYMSLPMFMDALSRTPELTSYDFLTVNSSRKLLTPLVPAAGIAACYVGFRVVSDLRIVLRAWREYRSICKRNQGQD